MIYLTGDIHGQIDIDKLSKKNWKEQDDLTRKDYLIQLGDLGLLWKEDKTFEYLLDFYTSRKYTLLWIDGNHPLSEDTEILTITGWKNIKNVFLNNDIEIATYDLATRQISYELPKAKKRIYCKTKIRIEGKKTLQEVDREHDIVLNGVKLKAKELLVKSKSETIKEHDIPISGISKYTNLSNDYQIELLQLAVWIVMKDISDIRDSDEPFKIRLLNPDKIKRVEYLLDKLGLEYETVKARGKTYKYPPYNIILSEKSTSYLRERFQDRLIEIPEAFTTLNKEQLHEVFKEMAFIEEQEQNTESKFVWITGSKLSVDRIQQACVLNDYNCYCTAKTNKKGKEYYFVTIDNENDNESVLEISELLYNKDMYCFSTSKGTLITRNEGKVAITGNCNFDMLKKYPIELWNGGKIHRIADNIVHLMRGQIYNINNYRFFTLGGARSIDKEVRLENISWWKDEEVNYEEQEEAYNNLKQYFFKTDYVLTHAAPLSLLSPMFHWNPKEVYTSTTERLLDDIYFRMNFKHWFFGHYHEDREYGKFTCLYNKIVNLDDYK